MTKYIKACLKLSAFFFFLAFLSGRIGLIAHEFIGHGLFAHIFGGNVGGFQLFLFGGGWIHYDLQSIPGARGLYSALVIDLSGIAVEMMLGSFLAIVARFIHCNRIWKALIIALSIVLIIHAGFYLTVGTYYGSGDGHILFYQFHEHNHLLVTLMAFLTVLSSFVLSFNYSPSIKSWIPFTSRKTCFVVLGVAMIVAAAFHATLTIAEQRIVDDREYQMGKTAENVKLKEFELSERIAAYEAEYGEEPSQEWIDTVEDELAIKYAQFPIQITLLCAIVAGLIIGFILSKQGQEICDNLVNWNDVWFLGKLSGCVILLLIFVKCFQ